MKIIIAIGFLALYGYLAHKNWKQNIPSGFCILEFAFGCAIAIAVMVS